MKPDDASRVPFPRPQHLPGYDGLLLKGTEERADDAAAIGPLTAEVRTETLRVRRHPCVPAIELKQLRYRSSDIGPRVFETLRVVVCLGWPVRFRSGNVNSIIPSGAMTIIEPGAVHSAAAAGRYISADILLIDAAAIADGEGENRSLLYPGVSLKERISTSAGPLRAFRALAAALADPTSVPLLVEERVCTFVEDLGSLCAGRVGRNETIDSEGVRRAREMIHDMLSESVTLDSLAAVSRLPKPRFLRAFRRLVGLPPHAYQMQLRVDHASRLIAQGASISDASVSAGFADQSHFHRRFTRLEGHTPGEYRSLKPR